MVRKSECLDRGVCANRTNCKNNLNIETEKSEQTLFAQISLSQYLDFLRMFYMAFERWNTQLDIAEFLSFSI